MERKRIKGPALVLIIGLAFATVTALSGIAASVFEQHDDSPITREVFGASPTPSRSRSTSSPRCC